MTDPKQSGQTGENQKQQQQQQGYKKEQNPFSEQDKHGQDRNQPGDQQRQGGTQSVPRHSPESEDEGEYRNKERKSA